MLTNYLKVALRNLWKSKGFSAINIIGLASGLGVCLLIVLYVADELNYDRYNEKADRIYRLDADLVTLGKILGGGLPCGAFGGKRRFMELLAPLGPVYQAGTLSGNPLAMAAGLATVGYLREHAAEVYPQLEAVSKAVAEGVAAEAKRAGVAVTLNRVGSMWTWFFTPNAVTNYDEAARSDTAAFGRFHRAMLEAGVWLPPSQFEAMFLGTAHGQAEVDATIAAARTAFTFVKA